MTSALVWRILQEFFGLILRVFFDLKVYGVRNVPRRGGVLLLSNHQSYLDPIVLAVRLPRAVSYFAKSELFENRFFGWLIGFLGAFPVKQGRGDARAIKETIARLREGRLLNIYPEGSRTEDGQIGAIEGGAALVVRHLEGDVTVVPAVIDGSFEAWPKGRTLPRLHPVSVMYGRPLDVAGKSRQEVVRLIDSTLRRMFADLKARRRT